MVSNTVGAWVKDGVKDQIISAMHVSNAISRLDVSVVFFIDLLLLRVSTALGED